MDCDKTLHVDSIGSRVRFCVIECGIVLAAKSSHVEKGDNLGNKHFSDFFTQNYTGSSSTASSLLLATKSSPSGKRKKNHLLAPSLSIASSLRARFVVEYCFLAIFSSKFPLSHAKCGSNKVLTCLERK